MGAIENPSPLQLLDIIFKPAGDEATEGEVERVAWAQLQAAVDLRKLLSGPLGTALADPAMRRALEIVAEGLPGIMAMSADASLGPWENNNDGAIRSSEQPPFPMANHQLAAFRHVASAPEKNRKFIVEVCNLIHRAAQAMEEPR